MTTIVTNLKVNMFENTAPKSCNSPMNKNFIRWIKEASRDEISEYLNTNYDIPLSKIFFTAIIYRTETAIQVICKRLYAIDIEVFTINYRDKLSPDDLKFMLTHWKPNPSDVYDLVDYLSSYYIFNDIIRTYIGTTNVICNSVQTPYRPNISPTVTCLDFGDAGFHDVRRIDSTHAFTF